MEFSNVYEDVRRADSYAKLEFPGTYYLAYRDIPDLISKYAMGKKALDFGCGTGRSTRFMQKLGYDVVGIDISEEMIRKANEIDPAGHYFLISDGNLSRLDSNAYDLVLSAFTFDNIPSGKKISLFKEIAGTMKRGGVLINLVSAPEIYLNEWASFSTKDFPENRVAVSGGKVSIIMTDVEDKRPVEDIMMTDIAYREIYEKAGLVLIDTHKPLGMESEQFNWINETIIPPWCIYILKKTEPK
ncbi:methyltransferase domain-containing protein [candidate division KSB1 bacterium]